MLVQAKENLLHSDPIGILHYLLSCHTSFHSFTSFTSSHSPGVSFNRQEGPLHFAYRWFGTKELTSATSKGLMIHLIDFQMSISMLSHIVLLMRSTPKFTNLLWIPFQKPPFPCKLQKLLSSSRQIFLPWIYIMASWILVLPCSEAKNSAGMF